MGRTRNDEGRTDSKTGSDTGHDDRDEVVEISVGGNVELEGSEADIVKSFVVDTEGLVRVFDQLMNRERSVVRLDDGVGDLVRRFVRQYEERRDEAMMDEPWGKERRRRSPSFDRGTPHESWR